MIVNVYQICIALLFAVTLEHVQGWRIDRRHTTITSSSSISTNSSSSISSTSSTSISSSSSLSISSTSSTSISSSSSSSSSSTSSSVESTSVLSLTEVVIPIKQSPAALNVEVAPTTSSTPLAVKTSASESQSVPSSTSTLSTSTSSAPSIESPQHVQSTSSSSSSSTDQKPIGVPKTTSSYESETSSSTGSEIASKSSTSNQAPGGTTSTPVEASSSTITPGPAYDKAWKWGVYPWGNHPSWDGYPWPMNSTIPSNTCWVEGSEDIHGGVWWRRCSVKAWKVKVSYFPTNTGTVEYPHTYVDPTLGITMTAPSIYLIVDNIGATNACGGLGPTFVDRVIAMDPADVFTLQGYADYSDHEQIGEPKVLNLDDLQNCDLEPYHSEVTTHEDWTERPLATDPFNRCSPRISWPTQIQSLGYKYWEHCGLEGKDYGLFDPPGAVPPINGGLLATKSTPVFSRLLAPAAPTPTVPLNQAPKTQVAPQAPPPSPSAVQPAPAPAQPSQASPPQVSIPPAQQQPPPSQPDNPPAQQQPPPPQGDNSQSPAPQGSTPAQQQPPPSPSPVSPPPPSVSVVAVVAGNTISAQAGSPNVILPNGSTANVGAQVTIAVNSNTNSNNNNNNNNVNVNNVNNIVVSVGSSGIFVASGNAPSTYYPNPVFVAQIPPTAGPNAAATGQMPTPIATIGGEVISAAPGASIIVYKGQTLTSGGPPVTLAGTDIVATLGSSGLIVQGPGGSIATYSVPQQAAASPAITSAAIIGTVNGEVISVTAGASSIIVGGQTLKLGGPLVTLSNNEVLSLGPSGIVVQAPGGGVRTIGSASQTTALGPAVFIADIIGATKDTPSTTSTSVSGLPSPSNTWNLRPLNGTSLTTSVAASLSKPSSMSLSVTLSQSPTTQSPTTQSPTTQPMSTGSITAPKGPPIAVASNPGVSIASPSSTQKSAASTLHSKCTSITALFSGLFCTYLLLN
ncbi:hypothetical protein BJ875DRAFT_540615 [Amylocarpus encephaloides]|uniref:Uncharacterized protein n=1 Tax=Amylocarpus encephaloides TaxID=45428 RepID=A0A9P7YNU2_9HELO|nr:hypothetical protein BJ875DRAFT_540615 [Amylocarpus encephaloides]